MARDTSAAPSRPHCSTRASRRSCSTTSPPAKPEFVEGREFYRGDIADADLLDRVFAEHPDIGATLHCAARIVVPESVAKPLFYYRENVAKTVELLEGLQRNGCTRVVFSSSGSIYAPTPDARVDESCPVAAAARTRGPSR